MKILLFLMSYFIGISTFYIAEEHYTVYLLLLFLYLAATDYLEEKTHNVVVIHSLILSYSSSMLLSLFQKSGEFVFVYFVIISTFLLIYQHIKGITSKTRNEIEDINIQVYVKRLILPWLFPVATYFIVTLFTGENTVNSMYWMLFFLTVITFSKRIKTKFYLLFFLLTMSLSVFYIFQYVNDVSLLEKSLVYLFVVLSSVGNYLNWDLRGGNFNLSFVQTLFRKKSKKQKDNQWVR